MIVDRQFLAVMRMGDLGEAEAPYDARPIAIALKLKLTFGASDLDLEFCDDGMRLALGCTTVAA
jgi:hypothetical protein